MPKYKNVCKVCGKEIETYMSVKKVCSPACRKIANKEYAREFMRKRRQGRKITCLRCKGEFTSYHLEKNVCLHCQLKNLTPKV